MMTKQALLKFVQDIPEEEFSSEDTSLTAKDYGIADLLYTHCCGEVVVLTITRERIAQVIPDVGELDNATLHEIALVMADQHLSMDHYSMRDIVISAVEDVLGEAEEEDNV